MGLILLSRKLCLKGFLFRLALTVQQKMEADKGNTKREQWKELVGDLWINQLPHLRACNDRPIERDMYTGQYGFQEGVECDSEEELMNDSMNKPNGSQHIPKVDIQTLEQHAKDYTPEQVGQFLKEIGLGHHVTTFIEEDIGGDMLLEATNETLEELGVTSATERLKIKVYVRE